VTWDDAMRAGRFDGAWEDSAAVVAARAAAARDDPALPYHLRWVWDGTPPDGRDVVVRCYHGLGDTVQFSRYLPALRARCARLVVEAQPALLGLLARLPGASGWTLHPFDPARPLPPGACDIEIMELGHVLRRVPPPLAPRLPAAPARDGMAKTGGRRVGLCWRAGGWDPARSVPLAWMLARPELRGAIPVSLQRGPAAAEADGRFANPGDDDRDVLATAALIASCDAVLSVDTLVAHLAATLGAATTVVLQARADWRWMRGGRTAWYPRARLLRREGAAGPWSEAGGPGV